MKELQTTRVAAGKENPMIPLVQLAVRAVGRVYGIRNMGQYCRLLVVKRELEKLRFTDVLDAGCGSGIFSRYIASRFPDSRITALDCLKTVFGEELKRDQRLSKRVVFLKEDLTKMGFSDRFDLILNINALAGAEPYMELILRNLYKALKSGGTLLLHAGNGTKVWVGSGGFRREEFLKKKIPEIGFNIDMIKHTFGPIGGLAWKVDVLTGRRRLIRLFILPLLKAMIYCDTLMNHKTGNGLFVVARKP